MNAAVSRLLGGRHAPGLARAVWAILLALGVLSLVPHTGQANDLKCAFVRGPKCDVSAAIARGMVQTGQVPVFPPGARCPPIDEAWAISYNDKRAQDALHGGIDMPAPFGTPIIAAADGKVIAVINDPVGTYRGREVFLQHRPDQTGLGVWVYTEYSHFDKRLKLRVGQSVRKGQVLGVTGNSGRGPRKGIQSRKRRPAIHFAAFYADSPKFRRAKFAIVPKDGYWMDPLSLYAGRKELFPPRVARLPRRQKRVHVPVMYSDGTFSDPSAPVIWPYMCSR